MASLQEVIELVRTAANDVLCAGVVLETQARDMKTWEGDAAIGVTLMLSPESVEAMTGEELIDMLGAIRSRFEAIGEFREPMVFYRTPTGRPAHV